MLAGGFGAFAKYDKNDLALDVHFRTGSDITDDELEWAYELVSSNLSPLGHRFKPQDKMDDLCDPSSRFFLVTERPASAASAAAPTTSKGKGKGKGKKMKPSSSVGRPVAFAHFRFTVEGEAQDAMAGVPVLLVRDLHAEPAYAQALASICTSCLSSWRARCGGHFFTPEGDAGRRRVFMSSSFAAESVDGSGTGGQNLAFSKSSSASFKHSGGGCSPAPCTDRWRRRGDVCGQNLPAADRQRLCAPGDDEDGSATPKSPSRLRVRVQVEFLARGHLNDCGGSGSSRIGN